MYKRQRIDDVDLRLKLALTKGISSLGVEFENKNILFWQQGESLINKVAASLQTDIEIDRSTELWTLKNTGLTINGIRLDVNGELKRDTVTKIDVYKRQFLIRCTKKNNFFSNFLCYTTYFAD